jgi:DNA-binding CsgD family transcriptional regulator
VKTVESHRAQLAERLGTRSTAELVRWAVRHGIVAPDS